MLELVLGARWTTLAPVSFQTSPRGHADVEVVGARALPDQERAGVEHDLLGAHRAADPLDGPVRVDDGPLGVEVEDVLRPVLDGRVARLRAFLDEDLDDGRVHRVDRVGLRGAALDVVHLGALVGDDQRVLEGALVGALHAEVGLQRQVDLHVLGHVEERAAGPDRAVQRRELVVLRRHALVHEVLAHEVLVLGDRRVHRAEDDALVRVLLLEPLVERLLAPHAHHAGEVLALRLRDAELLEGVLLLVRDVVPGVVAPCLGRRVEDEGGEVEIGQVHAPGGDGLALEDLKGLDALLAHPVGLALDLGELLDHLARDALLRDQRPCSFSLIELGLVMRVLSVAAIAPQSSARGGFSDSSRSGLMRDATRRPSTLARCSSSCSPLAAAAAAPPARHPGAARVALRARGVRAGSRRAAIVAAPGGPLPEARLLRARAEAPGRR